MTSRNTSHRKVNSPLTKRGKWWWWGKMKKISGEERARAIGQAQQTWGGKKDRGVLYSKRERNRSQIAM